MSLLPLTGVGPGGAGPSVSLPTPTAYYPFDNANDVCAAPANFPAGAYSGTAGLIGGAQFFASSGVGSNMQTGGAKFALSGQDWTLAYWMKFASASGGSYSPYVYISDNTWTLALGYLVGNYVAAQITPPGKSPGASIHIPPALTANAWHLLVMRQTGNVLYASVDGGAEVSAPYANVSIGSTNSLNARTYANVNACAIDELGWWNGTALNSTQRATLYNGGAGHTFNGTIWI